MTGAPTETAYFPGEFLGAADYAAEQAFQIGMQRAGGQAFNSWGIVRGLDIGPATTSGALQVGQGLGIDSLGRLVLLAQARLEPPPAAIGQVLTLTYGELTLVTPPGVVGTLLEEPVLAWQTPADIDPAINLVLGTWDGSNVTRAGRVYAGVPAGALTFRNPLTEVTAAVVAWSSESLRGLRIDAEWMSLAPSPPQQTSELAATETSLSILDGVLGVGTMSPQACLDVLAPIVALAGPGLLTSYDTVVRASDERFGAVLHPGDTLILADREGQPRQARVVSISSPTEAVTDKPLNCLDAAYTYEQALVVSVRNDAGQPALTIDRQAWTGLGVSPPQARLHVGAGDIEISQPSGAALSFGGDGLVTTEDGGSRVQFQVSPTSGGAPTPTRLQFDQVGDIAWLPGRVAAGTTGATAPFGMILDPAGNLGIGKTPTEKLDVSGALQLTVPGTGLVFPDGSVQTSSQYAVPVGAIIDWWQGTASQLPPSNFMICAGGVVNDPDSKLHGKAVPNLDNRFIVGAANDSQANGGIGSDTHDHLFTVPGHTHGFPHTHADVGGVTGQETHSDGMAGAPDNNASSGHSHKWTASCGEASTETSGVNSDSGGAQHTDMASTLPPYVSLLKLIRIK
ncbi:MAG: hypothetical protein Q7T61_16975 [Caulobacter sp.]|nr:hypothetical protein [Caulobacter sp.]